MKIDNRGFTLVEVLVCFSVVLLITSFFPILIKSIHSLTQKKEGINLLELDIFIHQSKLEIRKAQEVTTDGKVLSIINDSDQKITYEYYQGKIRRRVNGAGHEVLLQNIKELSFEQITNGAVFFITDHDEQILELRITAIRKEWNTDQN